MRIYEIEVVYNDIFNEKDILVLGYFLIFRNEV